MPISITTARDPFRKGGVAPLCASLKTPQLRVLAALVPAVDSNPVIEWPMFTRTGLARALGYIIIGVIGFGSIVATGKGIPSIYSDIRCT